MSDFIRIIRPFLKNESFFRLIYITCLFLSSICFLEQICWVLIPCIMVWGSYFLWKRISSPQEIRKIRYYLILILFLLSGVVTAFLNYKNNLFDNLVMIYHAGICFFLLYGAHATNKKEEQKLEMYRIFYILTTLINMIAFIGLLFLFVFVRLDALGYTVGLFDNRYTGFYTHPNIAAFTSVIGIIGSHILYSKKKLPHQKYFLPRWFCFIGIALNLLTIWLADSNASFVYVCLYFFFYYVLSKGMEKQKKSFTLPTLFRLFFVFTIFVLASYGLRIASQNIVMNTLGTIHTITSGDSTEIDDSSFVFPTIPEEIEIGRRDQSDLSSGRLDSYGKALLLLQFKPLFGMGKANIIPYGDTYLYEGFLFFDLHNGYLTILLSCGIIGFYLFAVFLIQLLRKAFYLLDKFSDVSNEDKKMLILFLSSLLGYGAYAMFERTLLFDITFMVIIFWTLLGYFMSYAITYEDSREKKHVWLKELINSLQKVKNLLL